MFSLLSPPALLAVLTSADQSRRVPGATVGSLAAPAGMLGEFLASGRCMCWWWWLRGCCWLAGVKALDSEATVAGPDDSLLFEADNFW